MRKQTSLSSTKVGNCSLLFSLDRRYKNKKGEYPIVITFTINYKRYYHRTGNFMTERDFSEVCNVSSSKNALMKKKKEWEGILEGYRARLAKIAEKQQLTLPLIRTVLSGVDITGEVNRSFIGIWEEVVAARRAEGRASTGENYEGALKSFRKIVGEVNGFAINKDVIAKWNDGMKNGVLSNGTFIKGVADATRGMYLRACRVIWNECVRQGFLTEVEYPFSNKDNSLISIPRGKRRQQSYLNVEEMTELYEFFVKNEFPKTFDYIYKERARQSLGIFLAQYLCNGCNLTDIARLRYNKTYWQDGGRAFEFQRKKTAARSSDNSVVIVPIIEPLRVILDEIAAPPTMGGYVFPFIFKGQEDEEERRKISMQENKNVSDRMQKIIKDVFGWEKKVSGTWARHSFATNLKLAGVEEEYIAESMGHSHGNDVTAGYMDKYPLEIRFRNNAKLLRLEEQATKVDLNNMSKAEMKALLEKMLGIASE